MIMNQPIFEEFYKIGVIPVLEIDSAERALPLAEALLAGGLPVAEVTLRTEAALDSIRTMAREAPEILVGAGTVINWEQAKAARDAGARFLVSPGVVEQVIIWAHEHEIPILPGAVTPTEMIRATNLGLSILKFFPAEVMGGLRAIQAMSDPFPQLRFIPTGGIKLENAAEYLQHPKIQAIGGSWMARREMIAGGKFDEITRLAKQASGLVKKARGQG
jgi:2-dehydro-3-deoxyphosphogluconate aldolase/(4S)-4-hydroxy-2-oxoglutarate aldolase